MTDERQDTTECTGFETMGDDAFVNRVDEVLSNYDYWRRHLIAMVPEMARRNTHLDFEFESLGQFLSVKAGISVPVTARILRTWSFIKPYTAMRALWKSAAYGWTKFEVVASVLTPKNHLGFADAIVAGSSNGALQLIVDEERELRRIEAARRAGIEVGPEVVGPVPATTQRRRDLRTAVENSAAERAVRKDNKGRPLVALNVRPHVRERLQRTFAELRKHDTTVPTDDSGMIQWLIDHADHEAFQKSRYVEVVAIDEATDERTVRTTAGTYVIHADELADSAKDGPRVYLTAARDEAEAAQGEYEEKRLQAGLEPNDYITPEAQRYLNLRSGGDYCEFPGCNCLAACSHHFEAQMLHKGHRVDRSGSTTSTVPSASTGFASNAS